MADTTTSSNWWEDPEFWLRAYSTYQQTQPGKFQQQPEDPGLTALRKQLLGYMQNSPTRNMLGDMLKPRLEAAANTTFQLPQGAQGYNPFPNGGFAPKYDLSKIFSGMSGGGAQVGVNGNPNSATPGQGVVPQSGQPYREGPRNQAGGTGDPRDPGSPNWGQTIGSWLGQNPTGNPRAYLPNGGQAQSGNQMGMTPSAPPEFVNKVTDWFKGIDWRKLGWNGITAAATAQFGPAAGLAMRIIRELMGGQGAQPSSGTGGGFNPAPAP